MNQPGSLLWLRSDGLTVDYQRDVIYNVTGTLVDVFYAPVPLTEQVNRTLATPIQRTVITTQHFDGNDTLQIASSGTVSNSDVYGATVWFDSDADSVPDSAESSAVTDIEGRYELIIPDAAEVESGVIRSIGGIDVGIGLTPIGMLASDPSMDSFTTPLTTLKLRLRELGLSDQQIQNAYESIFAIDNAVDVGNFDHFEEARVENPLAKNVLIAITAIQNISASAMELLSGMTPFPLSDLRARGALSESVYRAIAERFDSGLTTLTEQNEIVTLLRSIVDWAEQVDENHGLELKFDRDKLQAIIEGTAKIIVADVTRLVQLADEATTGHELVTRVNQSKKFTRVKIGPMLHNVGLDDVSIEEAVAQFADTSEAQLQQVRDILLPPDMTHVPDLATLEEQAVSVGFDVFDFETPFDELTVTVQSSNDRLLPEDQILVLPGELDEQRLLVITPAADQSGTGEITVTVQDPDGFSLSQTVRVTVTDVNDPPVFSPGPASIVSPNQGAVSIVWASQISAGTPAEDFLGQSVAFDVTVAAGDELLFDVLPTIDATTGQLHFVPDPTRSGVATVNARLVDDGGTENGGWPISDPVTFTITTTPSVPQIEVLIVDVLPNPREDAIDAINIIFSQPVTGFDLGDLVLRRDNSPNLLIGSDAELVTTDSIIWSLTNLSELTFSGGQYLLALDAGPSGIHNDAGLMLTADVVEAWNNTSEPLSVFDVNQNGEVTSLDALLVINYLARAELSDGTGSPNVTYRYDVNDSGTVTALDALQVINAMARSMADNAAEFEKPSEFEVTMGQMRNARSPVDLQDAAIRDLAMLEPSDQSGGKITHGILLRSHADWEIDNDEEEPLPMEFWDRQKLREESGESQTEIVDATSGRDSDIDSIVVEIAGDVTDQLRLCEATSQDSVHQQFI